MSPPPITPEGRPSQKLIAEKLGISKASVSLALRDIGTLSPKLVAKVKQAAKAMGYRPNPILSSLASKHFRDPHASSGATVLAINFLANSSQYFSQLRVRAEELGYTISEMNAKTVQKFTNPGLTLYNRGIQGILLVGPIPPGFFRKNFDWSLFSVVQCGRFFHPLPFDTVRPNIFQAIKLIYENTRKAGYKRIGFAVGRHEPILEDDESRLSAVLGLQQIYHADAFAPPPFFNILNGPKSELIQWVEAHQLDCVVGFHIGQCADIMEGGWQVPEQIGFACLHLNQGVTLGDARNLSIAGVEQNMPEIAFQSVNLLDQNIRHHIRGISPSPKSLLIDSEWIDGDSLPDRNQSR